jgi:outer membrane receptor for ferrienterochelin and colicin
LYKSQTVAPDTANKIDLRNAIRYYNFKAQFSYYPNEKHKINAGISGIRYELEPGVLNKDIVSNIAKVILDKEQGYELATYVDDEYKLSEKLRVQLGLRYVQYLSVGQLPNAYMYLVSLFRAKRFYKVLGHQA